MLRETTQGLSKLFLISNDRGTHETDRLNTRPSLRNRSRHVRPTGIRTELRLQFSQNRYFSTYFLPWFHKNLCIGRQKNVHTGTKFYKAQFITLAYIVPFMAV